MTTSGRARLLEQRRDPEPGVGADEAGRSRSRWRRRCARRRRPPRRRVSSPQTSPASRGEREADRADPAVEVEEPLAAGEAGELAGDRVEALGHLGVGLQEGACARRGSAGRRAPRSGARRRARRSARRCRPPGPSITVCRSTGGRGISSGEVTRRVWTWPVRRPSRTTRLRSDAGLRAAVVGGRARVVRPVADRVAGRVVGLRGELAVVDVDDLGPAAAAVEAERELARALAEASTRACCGSATRLDRGLDRLELEAVEAADPAQRLVDLRSASRRAGARRAAPATALPGRARRRARRCRRSARGSGAGARPRVPSA